MVTILISLIIAGIVFLTVIIVLSGNKNAGKLLMGWPIFMIILAFVPSTGESSIRLAGLPIGYFPFIIINLMGCIKSFASRFTPWKTNLPCINIIKIIFIFSLYAVITGVWAIDKREWFIYTAMWFLYIFLLLWPTISLIDNTQLLFNILKIFVYTVPIIYSLGTIRYFIGDNPNPFPMLYRNASAYVVLLTVPFVLVFYFITKRKLHLISFFILLINIFFMKSRTAYVSVLAEIIIIFMLFGVNRKMWFLFILLTCVFFSAAAFKNTYIEEGFKRFQSISNPFKLLAEEETSARIPDARRVYLTLLSWRIFSDNPFFGVGMGNLVANYPSSSDRRATGRPHNFYLTNMAEIGITGSLLFILFLFTILIYFRKAVKIEKDYQIKGLAKAFFTAHIGIVIALALNDFITLPFVWFFWGMGLSLYNSVMSKSRSKETGYETCCNRNHSDAECSEKHRKLPVFADNPV